METAKEYSIIGMKIGILFSIFISSMFFIFSNEFLYIFKAYDRVKTYGNLYMKIISISLLPNIFINIINSILRGVGNTKTPFMVSLIVSLSKVMFDFILIFGLFSRALGIAGAAIATLVSQLLGSLYLFLYMKKVFRIKITFKRKCSFKRVKDIISLTIPCVFGEAAYSLSRLICTGMIMVLGPSAFAANGIANTIEGMSVMPSVGIGIATTTLVGIKVGERDLKGAKKYASKCSIFALGMVMFFSIMFLTIPNFLSKLFISGREIEVITITAACLHIGSIEQPFIAISNIFSGGLKGMGDAKTPFIISTITGWCIRLPLIFYFIYILKKPVTLVWWITNLQWIIEGILMYIYFRKKFVNFRSYY